ncbi:hypothetical protein FMZ60_15375 [Alcaligenaceae bacterium SJ-26]|nr:hypothetical protein FMZ60_15375 [Alcaligenaceae bacterium SJ-26]
MRWRALSLRLRLFLAAAIFLIVTVLLVVLFQTMLAAREQVGRVVEQELPARLQGIANSIQAQLNRVVAGSEGLANNTYILNWIQEGAPHDGLPAAEAAMARVQKSLGANTVFMAIALPEGVRYLHYEAGRLQMRTLSPTEAADGWYFNFGKSGNQYELNLDNNPLSGSGLLMFINYRGDSLAATGHPYNVAGAGMSMQQLATLIQEYDLGEKGKVMLVEPNGRVEVDPDPARVGTLNLSTLSGYAALMANQWQSVRDAGVAISEVELDGEPMFVSAVYLPDLQRYLVAQMPASHVMDGIYKNQLYTLAVGCALVIPALLLFYGLTSQLMRPLDEVRKQLAEVTENLNLGLVFETRDQAEIGRMCHQLNHFVGRLNQVFAGVRHVADEIFQQTGHLVAGNQALASRSTQQAATLEETAASMEELTSSVQVNAENAGRANAQSDRMSDIAGQGYGAMTQMTQIMEQIQQSSNRIADIVSVIDSIAFQTNILALNAAVEAARAGEQGKGFAVVASEVRALAQRSASAAREIKGLIEVSSLRVDEGTSHVGSVNTTMQELIEAVQQAHVLNQDIAQASGEQAQGLAEVSVAVSQIDTTTQQNMLMVEQAVQAATTLEENAAHLRTLMQAFQTVPDSGTGQRPVLKLVA